MNIDNLLPGVNFPVDTFKISRISLPKPCVSIVSTSSMMM